MKTSNTEGTAFVRTVEPVSSWRGRNGMSAQQTRSIDAGSASHASADSPRFDRAKFLAACGVSA